MERAATIQVKIEAPSCPYLAPHSWLDSSLRRDADTTCLLTAEGCINVRSWLHQCDKEFLGCSGRHASKILLSRTRRNHKFQNVLEVFANRYRSHWYCICFVAALVRARMKHEGQAEHFCKTCLRWVDVICRCLSRLKRQSLRGSPKICLSGIWKPLFPLNFELRRPVSDLGRKLSRPWVC